MATIRSSRTAAPSGARHRRVVVLPGWATGSEDHSRQPLVLDRPATADGEGRLAGDPQHGERPVGLIATHADDRNADDGCDLVRNGGKELVGARTLGDERRHSAQGGLFFREPVSARFRGRELGAALSIRDRSRHQLGELRRDGVRGLPGGGAVRASQRTSPPRERARPRRVLRLDERAPDFSQPPRAARALPAV